MHLLSKSMSVNSAITFLTGQGYLVIDPTNKPKSNEEKRTTFTDKTCNELKYRILFLA